MYLATDSEGYKRCWGCGYDGNDKLDVFCNQCGVELGSRVYQILETDSANDFSAEAVFIKRNLFIRALLNSMTGSFQAQRSIWSQNM